MHTKCAQDLNGVSFQALGEFVAFLMASDLYYTLTGDPVCIVDEIMGRMYGKIAIREPKRLRSNT